MPQVAISWHAGKDETERWVRYFDGQATVVDIAGLGASERAAALAGTDILWGWNPERELRKDEYRLLGQLKLIQLISAGADHLPFAKIAQQVTVASNVGAYSEPIAEHALAMALALCKQLLPNHRRLMEGQFNQAALNRSIAGATVGIIGFGGIGQATARLMKLLGGRVWAINTSGRTDQEVDFIGTLDHLEQVLRASDIIVLSLALTKATRRLVDARELAWMKDDAILINVARADLIDEAAFYQHLKTHPRFAAGIDAWWVEPFSSGQFKMAFPYGELPNLLGSPHNSPMVPGVMGHAIELAAENIARFCRGEPVRGMVHRQEYE